MGCREACTRRHRARLLPPARVRSSTRFPAEREMRGGGCLPLVVAREGRSSQTGGSTPRPRFQQMSCARSSTPVSTSSSIPGHAVLDTIRRDCRRVRFGVGERVVNIEHGDVCADAGCCAKREWVGDFALGFGRGSRTRCEWLIRCERPGKCQIDARAVPGSRVSLGLLVATGRSSASIAHRDSEDRKIAGLGRQPFPRLDFRALTVRFFAF